MNRDDRLCTAAGRDAMRGDFRKWAKEVLAEWLATYQTDSDGLEWRVVHEGAPDLVFRVETPNREATAGRYRVAIHVEEVEA